MEIEDIHIDDEYTIRELIINDKIKALSEFEQLLNLRSDRINHNFRYLLFYYSLAGLIGLLTGVFMGLVIYN